jgi:DNA repair protein RecO (recombination protein O)
MARVAGYVTEALVLRTVPFGESSQVVHLATPEHGLVSALAKGAHRAGSAVEGGVPLLAHGRAWLKPAPRRADLDDGLELLTRFRQREGWRALGKDLARYRAACYVLELMRAWMRPALPAPALFGAGVTALRALEASAPAQVPAWTLWFEARAVAAGGHRPALEACAACGAELDGAVLFAPAAGGAVHVGCWAAGPRVRLTGPALAALRRLYTQRLSEFTAAPPAPSEQRALRRVHDAWIPWLLERRPRSRDGLPST